jgi:hypothetical protein
VTPCSLVNTYRSFGMKCCNWYHKDESSTILRQACKILSILSRKTMSWLLFYMQQFHLW